MMAEHCSRKDSRVLFVTGNYNIRTCPANEWDISVRSNFNVADMRHGRNLNTIEKLMKQSIVRLAKLRKCEVISVVLYTGPMVSRKHNLDSGMLSSIYLNLLLANVLCTVIKMFECHMCC